MCYLLGWAKFAGQIKPRLLDLGVIAQQPGFGGWWFTACPSSNLVRFNCDKQRRANKVPRQPVAIGEGRIRNRLRKLAHHGKRRLGMIRVRVSGENPDMNVNRTTGKSAKGSFNLLLGQLREYGRAGSLRRQDTCLGRPSHLLVELIKRHKSLASYGLQDAQRSPNILAVVYPLADGGAIGLAGTHDLRQNCVDDTRCSPGKTTWDDPAVFSDRDEKQAYLTWDCTKDHLHRVTGAFYL